METVLLGLLLLAPLIWLLLVLSTVHRAALATTTAAREAGSEVAGLADASAAREAIVRVVAVALEDQQLDPRSARVESSWAPGLPRGTAVQIEVSYPVPVLRAPFLGAVAGPAVWVDAVHIARVDPYGSRR